MARGVAIVLLVFIVLATFSPPVTDLKALSKDQLIKIISSNVTNAMNLYKLEFPNSYFSGRSTASSGLIEYSPTSLLDCKNSSQLTNVAITYRGSAGNLSPVETTSMRLSNNTTLKFNETGVFHEMKQMRRPRNRVGGEFSISCILVSSSMALVFVLVWGLELHFQFERFRRFIFPRALALGKILLGNFLVLCFRKVCEFLRRNWLALAVGILVASGWPYGALLASIASSVYALIMLWWPRT